ncbi:hypothetical protein Afil01_42450 [Actinorhabdospora filicis]|uniref:DUF1023 domain-containing protein n=1 Tax=Actinorhabdospora filicis TaxID=1785913 RepID=A0A9W6SNX2_9ACTN|nr:alpha/beta hydrolase [Actinorhabdospora filicis]GLZ79438.1 hypothetical protein Afil01_42450 [Actinorhabdospora filicis]
MDLARLRDADLAALADAAATWRGFAVRLYEVDDALPARVIGPLAAMTGEATTAAQESLASLRGLLESRAMRAEAMADVFEQVHDGLTPLQRDLRTLLLQADAERLTVGEDGVVTAPEVAPVHHEYTDAIAGILSRAETLEASAVAAVTDITPERIGVVGVVGAHEFNDVRDDAHENGIALDVPRPRDGMSPEEARDWWNGLGLSGQRAFLLAYPEEAGAMDGLPTGVRDEANRWNLRRDIEVGWDRDAAADMLAKLESRDHLPPEKRAYLISYQPPGPNRDPDARIVASIGDPARAANTGIYVPGMTTDLPSFSAPDGGFDRTVAMYNATDKFTDAETAMVFWLGYDPPDAPDLAEPGHLAAGMSDNAANAGTPGLDRFINTLNATHDDSIPSHTTVVAHSYGSTLTGIADSTEDGLAVDDILFVGSPGVEVSDAEDLHVGAEHVWVEAADDDEISYWGNHGTDPAGEDFGANRLLTDTPGHSGYWIEDSISLNNMGAILADHPEKTTRTDPRNEFLGMVVE